MAIGILLGVYDIQTVAMTAVGTAIALASTHFFVFQDRLDVLQLIIGTLVVFTTVTAYFLQLRTKAKLLAGLENLANERDELVTGLPENTQVLILSKDRKTRQLLASL